MLHIIVLYHGILLW